MAPNPRVVSAFRAMKAIGIQEDKVKPVLKRLLKLYDKNWELIEEENYRALADAIFEDDDPKEPSEMNQQGEDFGEDAERRDESERPLKRLRKEGQASTSPNNGSHMGGGALAIKPRIDEQGVRGANSLQRSMDVRKLQPEPMSPQNHNSQSPQARHSYKGKEPMYSQAAPKERRPIMERPSHAVQIRDSVVDQREQKTPESYALIKPKDEPVTDDVPRLEAPIAVIRPDSSVRRLPVGNQDNQEPPTLNCGAEQDGSFRLVASREKRANSKLAAVQDGSFTSIEIASSSLGEERLRNVTTVHVSKESESAAVSALGDGSADVPSCGGVSPRQIAGKKQPISKVTDTSSSANGCVGIDRGHETKDSEANSLVVVPQHQLTSVEIRSLCDFNDMTKGEELVEISWLNEINKECPSSFNYIRENLIFQNANLKFTLSQIKAEDCCSTCIGDCLSSTTVCGCAAETGDKFAYTSEGLLREDFLIDCISVTRDPQQQCLSFCKSCLLERSKNEEILEPCKGHLKRKHIKECWSKCACHMLCGNRIVQRGIVCKLQVFFTPEGKGWGLRALENLPKGTFVCEYAGEILTNKELHERYMLRTRGADKDRHTYSVLLDAYWDLKGAMKEEEALCLDAKFYGNVARFINHRCLDANLIEIPVKIETPDHHYYHLAFFTSRDVDTMEELTWDYGIDFNDSDHPLEVFHCLCGSKFCRNMKRSSRSKHALR